MGHKKDESEGPTFKVCAAPTSLFVSMIHSFISRRKRHRPERNHTIKMFSAFLAFASSKTCCTLTCLRLGDDLQVTWASDYSMAIPKNCIWTDSFFRQHVAATWADWVANGQKPWLRTSSPLQMEVGLVEIIGFCLDPDLPVELSQRLASRGAALLGNIAAALDTKVSSIAARHARPIHHLD